MTGKIIIVGVGALGSHVALLGRNWEQGLKLVDFDRVESKNLMAQLHTKQGVSKNKAQGLQRTLQGLFGVKVEAVPHKLTADNVEALLGGSALVLDCTDNIEARRVIRTGARNLEVPCLHGALAADGSLGRIIWTESFTPDSEGEDGQATCEDGELLPFFALVASQMAWVAQEFLLTGRKQSFQVWPGGLMRVA
jgi:molybdopterin/thiamine biosynthesis adenylyltransferase